MNASPEPGSELAVTERRNDRTTDIDIVPTIELLRMLNAEDALVATAVAQVAPVLAEVVEVTVGLLKAGGRVHYFGAGSSGRIGVLDAAEVVPTFGVEPGIFVAHQAGGDDAVRRAIEGAEDSQALGAQAGAQVAAGDIAIGLSASGRTPYVAGALTAARATGATTALVSSNPSAPLAGLADYPLLVATGPEAIAGSTRLKAATAQKLVLNSLSTAVMIRRGRTYSNLMVALAGSNAKLRRRQITILMEASGASETACRAELTRCDGNLRLALLCLLSGLEPPEGVVALTAAGGSVRAVLDKPSATVTPPPDPSPSLSPRFTASYQAAPGRPADGFAAVSGLLTRALAAGAPPAVSCAVITSVAGASYLGAGGWARLPGESADPVESTMGTAFDLASLTKVVATVPLALLLHQRGRWEPRRARRALAAGGAGVGGDDQAVPDAYRWPGAAPAVLRDVRRPDRHQGGGARRAGWRRWRAGGLQRPRVHAAWLGDRALRGLAA